MMSLSLQNSQIKPRARHNCVEEVGEIVKISDV